MKATLKQIPALAKSIASQLKGGETLGLVGDLGSGKTAWTKELAKNLGVKRRVTSPTFIMHNSFAGTLPNTGEKITLHHLDVYRLKKDSDFKHLAIGEFAGQPNTVTVIEWADRVRKMLPKKTQYIYFQ